MKEVTMILVGFLVGAVVGVLVTCAYLAHLVKAFTGVDISGCLAALILLILITGCSIGLMLGTPAG
jgi:hypothetical protein